MAKGRTYDFRHLLIKPSTYEVIMNLKGKKTYDEVVNFLLTKTKKYYVLKKKYKKLKKEMEKSDRKNKE